MKLKYFILIIMLATAPLSAGQILINDEIVVSDNIFSDSSQISDVINNFSISFANNKITKKNVIWLSLYGSAENYISNDSESNYLFSGSLKKRWKYSNSVLDVSGNVSYDLYPILTKGNVIDNSSYTQLLLKGNVHYRYDFDAVSLHLDYSLMNVTFPNYTLDNLNNNLSLHLSIDPALFTTIDLKASFSRSDYFERYVMDSSGDSTADAFYDNKIFVSLGVSHFFNPSFSVGISGYYEKLDSNGNFYFFGPDEIILIPDGDELLINNFYSYSTTGINLQIMKNINRLKIELDLNYALKNYDGRLPLDSSDLYITGVLEEETVLGATLKFTFHLTETSRLFFSGSHRNVDSNNFKENASSMAISAGGQVWF